MNKAPVITLDEIVLIRVVVVSGKSNALVVEAANHDLVITPFVEDNVALVAKVAFKNGVHENVQA